jgi:hypothetical protein
MNTVIENTIAMRIIPRAILNDISPRAVSNAIDVVNTRVTYLMFPPNIIAMPSSAKARLKEAIIARLTPHEASFTIAKYVCSFDAPNVLAKSLNSISVASKALLVKLINIGVMSNA